jgi:hypothetical protein
VKERKTIEGRWWVFGPHRAPRYGELVFDPEVGLSLRVKIPEDLSSETGDRLAWARGEIFVPDKIVGRDQHEKPITLYECQGPSYETSSALLTITIHPLYALLGIEGQTWHEPQFTQITARATLLHNWMSRRAITRIDNPGGYTFTAQELPPVNFTLANGIRGLISSVAEYSHGRDEAKLGETHCVSFRAEQTLTADALLEYVRKFCRLLTIFCDHQVYPTEIHLLTGGSPVQTAEVLYINKGIANAERNEIPENMLASFSDLSAHISTIVSQWYDLYSRLDSALNLYFATVFNSSLYSNHQFLFLAQAIEVYHRRNSSFASRCQPTAEFRAQRDKLINHVPPDERDWLRARLQHANEKTLAQRLDEILAAHQPEVSKLLEDPALFSRRVRATRNHFTHYSTKPEEMDNVATGARLGRLTYQLRTLLEICIFHDLGIRGAPVERLIKGHARLIFLD